MTTKLTYGLINGNMIANAADIVAGTAGKLATAAAVKEAALPVLASQVNLSGTSVDFTDIPAGVKRITVMCDNISTNGTSVILMQIGDSGGVETSGYTGGVYTSNTLNGGLTSGFAFRANNTAASQYHVVATLTLMDIATNKWMVSGTLGQHNGGDNAFVTGVKSLSGVLDRIRLTMTNGTDTFDGGTANIMWEF
jgi:hypothetical protein